MRFYDKNGNIHENIFQSIWADLTTDAKEVPQIMPKVVSVNIELESEKSIKIDYANNKIYLMDKAGNIITEKEIDSVLTAKIFDNINIAEIDPKLMDPDYVDQILHSDQLQVAVEKLGSSEFSGAIHIDNLVKKD